MIAKWKSLWSAAGPTRCNFYIEIDQTRQTTKIINNKLHN